MKEFFKGTAAIITVIVVIVLVFIASWFLYWKLHKSSVNREATINQTSYNRQIGLVDDIDRQFNALNVPNITEGQVKAFTVQLCDDWSKLTPTFKSNTSQAIHVFVLQECQ